MLAQIMTSYILCSQSKVIIVPSNSLSRISGEPPLLLILRHEIYFARLIN